MRRNFVLLGLLLTISAPADAGIEEATVCSPQITAGSRWTAGQPVIDKVHGRVQGFQDYVFDSMLVVNTGDSIKNSLGHFAYKRDKKIRVECASGTVNKGAVVVRNDAGKIRAAGGGMLKFMKMNLEPDSRLLILANGYNVVDSDLDSLLKSLQVRLATSQAYVTVDPVKDAKTGALWRVVEVRKGSVVTDRIIVGASDLVPVEWDLYKDGAIYSVARFNNFKANVGLDDKLFDL